MTKILNLQEFKFWFTRPWGKDFNTGFEDNLVPLVQADVLESIRVYNRRGGVGGG